MSFLNKKIFNENANIFGLDLSDLSVKLVKLEDTGSYEYVASYASVPIPVGCISDGEIQKKEQVVSAIKKAIKIASPKKIKTKKVICSLPETKAFLRVISIPEMNESEMHEAIKWEMEANIPLTLEQVYYAWQILPSEVLLVEKNKINILVVAIAKTVVEEVLETLELAGLEPVGLDIESIAQARSLILEENKQTKVLIVDIGDRRTSFSIAIGGFPCFTSSIPLCGQALTDAIAKGMNVSYDEAEKIKISYGIGNDLKNDPLFKLQHSIDFYLTGLKYSKTIDKIILCGGGANTKGILPYLSKKLKREIEIGNPWINIKLGKNLPAIDKNQSVQYSTALGLALKGLHYEDIP